MNYTDAQNLLGVPRYVSQIELRKKYIALIKIHHPDVNSDKKKANKITADINQAYEVVLIHRESDGWGGEPNDNRKDKPRNGTGADAAGANNNSKSADPSPKYNIEPWENAAARISIQDNPFWDPYCINNYSHVPECFNFIGITNRFPSEKSVGDKYNQTIKEYHPSKFNNSQNSVERCRNICLAYIVVRYIRQSENWSQITEEAKTRSQYKTESESNIKSDSNIDWDSIRNIGLAGFMIFSLLKKIDFFEKPRSSAIPDSKVIESLTKNTISSDSERIIKIIGKTIINNSALLVKEVVFYGNPKPDGSNTFVTGYAIGVWKGSAMRTEFKCTINRETGIENKQRWIASTYNLEWEVPNVENSVESSNHKAREGPFIGN